jgi:hypothetical protein
MRFRLLKIVTWLVVVIVLSVAISVALLRVFVFTGAEDGHSSVVTDKALAEVQAQLGTPMFTFAAQRSGHEFIAISNRTVGN